MKDHVTVIDHPNRAVQVTPEQTYLREAIRTSPQFKGWTLFVQPHLNSMQPDFILTHPSKGILIIEVKEWHLSPPEYISHAQVLGANGDYFTDNPVDQVTAYKNLILKYELDTFLEAIEHHSDEAFAMVTPIVYFPNATRENALNFLGHIDSTECLIWSKLDLDELCGEQATRDDQRFPSAVFTTRSKFARGPDKLMQKLVANLEDVLDPNENALSQRRPLTLTREQDSLVPIQPGSIRRWGGVAGSGKTVVIATKAAEAVRQGQRVLVLSYNMTLRHYLRDLCSRQFVGDDRRFLQSHLTIAHFAGFLKILMVELGIRMPSESVEVYPEWSIAFILNKINTKYPAHLRYDSIFIDEGQDFRGDWIRFLKNVSTGQGELLVMYDEAQSVLQEDKGVWITDSDEIAGIGFRGEVGHLSMTQRLPNEIVHQIDRLSDVFGVDKKLDTAVEQIDLFTDITWQNIRSSEDRTAFVHERVQSILSQTNSKPENITVITMRDQSGIEMVHGLHELGWSVSHVFDRNESKKESLRRDEKWKFQPKKDRLNVSSYHSYKGWESSHVIFLLEGIGDDEEQWENMLDALYMALTRVSAFSDSRSFLSLNRCSKFNELKKYF